MRIIICLDDNNGMMFNNRRQSRDKKVIEDISNTIRENNGFLNCGHYTQKMFEENYPLAPNLVGNDELPPNYHFVENKINTLEFVTKITIYRWNRVYPADIYFEFDLEGCGFEKTLSTDFPGNSHESITKEIWKKI